jgi:hypothetical protein
VQDLVGVGVADATEDARIGERALQRVVLVLEPLHERRQIRSQDFEPPRRQREDRFFTRDDVDGCLTFRALLGEDRGAVWKVEGRQSHFARERRAFVAPPETAGDHQMQDEKEVPVERKHDPFPESP